MVGQHPMLLYAGDGGRSRTWFGWSAVLFLDYSAGVVTEHGSHLTAASVTLCSFTYFFFTAPCLLWPGG